MYSSYTVSSFAKIYDIALNYKVNLLGVVSWSFEFEDQPWFHGFRDLATNGIDKPVLNVFRMFGMMDGKRVEAISSGGFTWKSVIDSGVRGTNPDINALASKQKNETAIMLWNYHDDDRLVSDTEVELIINGIPSKNVMISQFSIDKDHSNSYEAWLKLGSPRNPDPDQYRELEKAGQLQKVSSGIKNKVKKGSITINSLLPRQGVRLFIIKW
jgi:xylan 1,4-beta-xylosidase